MTEKKSLNTGWKTVNSFQPNEKGNYSIDWIFETKESVNVLEAELVLYDSSKQYPSDHLPVTARLRLK